MPSKPEFVANDPAPDLGQRKITKLTMVSIAVWILVCTWILLHFRAMAFGLESSPFSIVFGGLSAVLPCIIIQKFFDRTITTWITFLTITLLPTILVNAYFLPEEYRFIADYQNQNDYYFSVERAKPFDWCSLHYDEDLGFWTMD